MASGSSQSRRALSHTQNSKQAALKQDRKPLAPASLAMAAPQRDLQHAKMLNPRLLGGSSSQAGSRPALQLQKNETTMRRRRLGEYSTASIAKPNAQALDERQPHNEDLEEMNAQIRAATTSLYASKGKSMVNLAGVKKDIGKDVGLKPSQTLARTSAMAKSQQKLETINEESSSKGLALYRTADPRAGQPTAAKKMLRGQSSMGPDSATTELAIVERRTASQMSTRKVKAAKPEWQLHYERQRKRKNAG